MKWVRAFTVAVAGLALGAAAACGQGGAVAGDAVQPAAAAPGDYDYDTSNIDSQGIAQASAVGVANAGQLGQIIVDGQGKSLYRFDKDTAKPPKSNCEGDCAADWPPAMVTDPAQVQVEGVDKTLVGSVDRTDGSKQLTIGGWPAYYYAKDAKAGDVNGQGVGGTWFAFTPAGKKAGAQNAAPAVVLAVMNVAPLGAIVTDKDGMTLYRFDKDTKAPSKSNCDGSCAEKWPPLLQQDGAQLQLTGVDQANVGVVTRSDGTKQVTLGGWPLYKFAGDKKSCDINGHGLDGVWFAATATGGKAKAKA